MGYKQNKSDFEREMEKLETFIQDRDDDELQDMFNNLRDEYNGNLKGDIEDMASEITDMKAKIQSAKEALE